MKFEECRSLHSAAQKQRGFGRDDSTGERRFAEMEQSELNSPTLSQKAREG